jgi:NAD(P)-dependent dehydrogenase (short-subunit alcohol dehydrogenase family)
VVLAEVKGARRAKILLKEIKMLLEDKVAVIYGAGGAVGRAVTLAFAREEATLFLTGRHAASVAGLARGINAGSHPPGRVVGTKREIQSAARSYPMSASPDRC